jgi:polyferredoxin
MRQQTLRKLRLASQIIFFALFVFLLVKTEFRGSLKSAATEIRLPYPVGIFLEADPLVAVCNALSTHSLYRGLIWCLVILIPTFLLGRFFCGWICPLGSLNHFFSNMKSERKRGPQRLELNRYKKWQALKYYILAALLASALFGSLIVGVLDPISLLVRSLGLSILPGVNYGLNAFLDLLYNSQVGPFRMASIILQFILQALILSFKQPYFHQALFLGLLFLAIVVLNLRITRFWCRALCPLGALLGIASRWAIFGLEKHTENCHD